MSRRCFCGGNCEKQYGFQDVCWGRSQGTLT
jgi:hypothetical protein